MNLSKTYFRYIGLGHRSRSNIAPTYVLILFNRLFQFLTILFFNSYNDVYLYYIDYKRRCIHFILLNG